MVKIVTSISELRTNLQTIRQSGKTVGFVPTMGALHYGHGALIDASRDKTDFTVVSIFVNPKQFAPHEDLKTYPRQLQEDVAFCKELGVDLVFAPTNDEMYPDDFVTKISMNGMPALGLEADSRPHFFDGVATVVTKLLMCVFPDIAFFGEKDFQQLCVIKQLVKDLSIPIEICGVATIREKSGLALSSRNAYLQEDRRNNAATILNQALNIIKNQVQQGSDIHQSCEEAKTLLLQSGFSHIDYIVVCDSDTLMKLDKVANQNKARILGAAIIDGVRLIDNISVA